MTSQRKIIHVDMDCFYAAIEIRNNSQLQSKPIAVGGSADRRGVICTCNYLARKYGVHSAMSSKTALRHCPDLILLPVDMPAYRAVAKNIQKIFYEFTDLVEPLSLDEAYLDVTQCSDYHGSATLIAQEIRSKILRQEKLVASAGVAPNKFLAKIASGWKKPDGLFVITPNEVADFVKKLAVKEIFGVGKVMAEKLKKLNIKTCHDLQKCSLAMLVQHFGKFGKLLYDQSRGVDDRCVNPQRIRKSLSVEHTFANDLISLEEGLRAIQNLYDKLLERLEVAAINLPIKTLYVKIKFFNFVCATAEIQSIRVSYEPFTALFKKIFMEQGKTIRLIGLGVRFKENDIEPLLIQHCLKLDL